MVENTLTMKMLLLMPKKNNTQSDKSKVTKEIIYSKLHPTHPSGVYIVKYNFHY